MTDLLIPVLAAISLFTPVSMTSSVCDRNVQVSYMNGAVYMVAKADYDFAGKPRDCSDILHMGHIASGNYTVWPDSRLLGKRSIEVYCDMETEEGGWTVIQRREYWSSYDYFDKNWESYKNGFGNISRDFWLGNDYISALTNQRLYTARFELQDYYYSKAYAQYDTFWIDDENNKYMLHVAGYWGTAGDSLAGYHNNHNFSTKDQDNDSAEGGSCAGYFSGGWWYNDCHVSNLNGRHLVGNESYGVGMTWVTWKGREFLRSSQIKIRPRNFKLT